MCQAAHAAHESGIHLSWKSSDISSIVVCSVSDERSLLRAASRLNRDSVRAVLFREPDMKGQATALATEPLCGKRRRVLARYKLWKGDER